MACVTMGFWCSSNVKMPMLSSMSSPRISCRSIPIPPLNPRDPFLSKLVSVTNYENPETPPHLNLFENPKLMANTDQVESAVSVMYNEHTPRQHSPDLQSFLLRRRIVYIGMPVALEREASESFAIYDTMMRLTNKIQTVAVGSVIGQACLLLAAGKKGRRFMFPHARVMIRPPHGTLPGTRPTSDIGIGTDGAFKIRDTLVELLAKHTGSSKQTLTNVMREPFYMTCTNARDFGIVDKILWHGQEELMKKMEPPKDWDRKAGIKIVDGM